MHRKPINSLNLTKSAFLTFKRYQPITALNMLTSVLVKPILVSVKSASAPVITTVILLKLLNVLQLAAHAKTY